MRIYLCVLRLIGPSREYTSPDWIQAEGLVVDIPKGSTRAYPMFREKACPCRALPSGAWTVGSARLVAPQPFDPPHHLISINTRHGHVVSAKNRYFTFV
eukprot:5325556-Pyramimonas_sp.AAC.1